MQEIKILVDKFEKHADPEQAIPMASYMKNHLPFLGIKTPERNQLLKEFFSETEINKMPFSPDFVKQLWSFKEREYHYAALSYCQKYKKVFTSEHIPFFQKLITTNSWWDTVDTIAPHIIGEIASRFLKIIPQYIDNWATDENMWLKRSAILFQLKYKSNTNADLLYRYCLVNADSKEFFIQKAIGWALREYSKTNPESVRNFIQSHTLPELSIREGSKYI
ncbi:DNA alkylation repair protein [Heyndrickxia shackletonii]|uniref:DNA alkylation repair protein n=1 Tax=Heyndrickxia shackletonii TaxID=157838 RepID=A0A0Q3WQU7_9BACI|nr:DNA alkylation repair protein [Heyndrickxia shackletonii]KQL50339.1 DNA alkylation repair protein [Heyndrickxia shackletonii]NEZ01626.1 DNA alkylation repair protein [Heyndrickxia shackletonii]